jgi:hypothetical protein
MQMVILVIATCGFCNLGCKLKYHTLIAKPRCNKVSLVVVTDLKFKTKKQVWCCNPGCALSATSLVVATYLQFKDQKQPSWQVSCNCDWLATLVWLQPWLRPRCNSTYLQFKTKKATKLQPKLASQLQPSYNCDWLATLVWLQLWLHPGCNSTKSNQDGKSVATKLQPKLASQLQTICNCDWLATLVWLQLWLHPRCN